jgi:hypothetical protein
VDLVITDWALDSYLDLVSRQVFNEHEYRTAIRPDVERLHAYPADPKFTNSKFWSPAQDAAKRTIPDGYKMKWHNIGSGKVQLRLPVGMFADAILCEAYVKQDPKHEHRALARFKVHLQLIRNNRYTIRGKLP